MPKSPAAGTNWLVGLFSGLDRHIWHEALILPAREILANNGFDFLLAGKVVFRGGGEEGLLPALA